MNTDTELVTAGWDDDGKEIKVEIPADIAAALEYTHCSLEEQVTRLEKVVRWMAFVVAQIPRYVEVKTKR